MSGPDIITMGCRLNIAESEAIRQMAADQDDLIVVNSCAVTAEAVRQTRQAIRRARRERPDARILVTGCAAQTEPQTFAAMAEVDAVIGNREKMEPSSYISPFGSSEVENLVRAKSRTGSASDLDCARSDVSTVFEANGGLDLPKVRVADIMTVRDTAPHMASAFADHARAFLEVQNGCDHRCTFCIIPYGRGNSRSVPMGAVVDQIARLVDNGYEEVVITGVDATSYGADLPGSPSLGTLAATILRQVPELRRLRLSSIDSIEVDRPLIDLIADEPRFMPHLHLSLQHGDDLILKRMKRRHSRDDAVRFCRQVRDLRPGFAFGADLIAGFPTETEEMFARSLDIVDECGLAFLHVFPFSPREGTPAARMPQLDRGLIKRRAARLRARGDQAYDAHLEEMAAAGGTQPVLVEFSGTARTENFTPVVAPGAPRGQMALVRINGRTADHLTGELAGSVAGRAAVPELAEG